VGTPAPRLPESLRNEWRREPEWLDALPGLAAECAAAWALELEEPYETPLSLVVPAGDAVLKLNAPSHFEADHEADALARWDGRGAVRLLARDDERRALLVERCVPGTPLSVSGEDETAVIVDVLARLPYDPGPARVFRRLADEAERWIAEVPERYERGGRPFERTLLDAAVEVFRSVDPDADRLVNQDLHAWNILRATREPWLAIDPKPLVGEPELDGVGPLRNAGLSRAGAAVTRTLDALADLGLDRERLRGLGYAHALAWAVDSDGEWSTDSIEAARTIHAAA
jgi:streptomycin 6-kinase